MEAGQIVGLCIVWILILMLDYFIVFNMLKEDVFEDKNLFWICMIPLVVYIVLIIALFFGFCEWVKKQTLVKEIKDKYNQLK